MAKRVGRNDSVVLSKQGADAHSPRHRSAEESLSGVVVAPGERREARLPCQGLSPRECRPKPP